MGRLQQELPAEGMPPEHTAGINKWLSHPVSNASAPISCLWGTQPLPPAQHPVPFTATAPRAGSGQEELLRVPNPGESGVNGMELHKGTFRLNIRELH